jgi:hypothetical protein
VKHLGFFGLFPDATGPTSLRAINMRLTHSSAWHQCSYQKNDDLLDKALASKWSLNRVILSILHYLHKIAMSAILCGAEAHEIWSSWG